MKRRTALAITRTLAIYGFAGWVYIALVALVHPYTLGLQLTHFAKYPHEDTFGESCFGISFVSFLAYNLLRSSETRKEGEEASVSSSSDSAVNRSSA